MSLAETSAPAGDAPLVRWGDFLIGQKVTKDPPKAGPSPALWNPPRGTGFPCVLLFSALDGSGHIDGVDVLWVVLAPLYDGTSIPRALPWCAAVPSGGKPRWLCQTKSLPCAKGGGPASAGSEGLFATPHRQPLSLPYRQTAPLTQGSLAPAERPHQAGKPEFGKIEERATSVPRLR